MPAISLTISLERDATDYVDDLVRSGRFATRHEVVQAWLQASDTVLDSWLRDEVVPVAVAMMANPARAIPIDDVFSEIEQLHASRMSADDGDA